MALTKGASEYIQPLMIIYDPLLKLLPPAVYRLQLMEVLNSSNRGRRLPRPLSRIYKSLRRYKGAYDFCPARDLCILFT